MEEGEQIPEGYVRVTMAEGCEEIVPDCPADQDPVDYYMSDNGPLKDLSEHEENQE